MYLTISSKSGVFPIENRKKLCKGFLFVHSASKKHPQNYSQWKARPGHAVTQPSCVLFKEQYHPLFPSDRIITTRTRKLTMEDFFNVGEFILILLAGFFLLKIMFGFAAGMEAWSELDKLMRGY